MEQFQSSNTISNLGELEKKLSFENWYAQAKKQRQWNEEDAEAARIRKEHELLPNVLGMAARAAAAYFSGGTSEASGMGDTIQNVGTTVAGGNKEVGLDNQVQQQIPYNKIDIAKAMQTNSQPGTDWWNNQNARNAVGAMFRSY